MTFPGAGFAAPGAGAVSGAGGLSGIIKAAGPSAIFALGAGLLGARKSRKSPAVRRLEALQRANPDGWRIVRGSLGTIVTLSIRMYKVIPFVLLVGIRELSRRLRILILNSTRCTRKPILRCSNRWLENLAYDRR